MVCVERLCKSYTGRPVLRDLDHCQAAGETVVFIGPSGCGKTTFLRCLNALARPDSGRITVGGVTLDHSNREDSGLQRQLRLRAGMVFQQFHLFPHRTALQNILEGPVHVLGQSMEQAEPLALELLSKVGLLEQANLHPFQLSGGQQQRVAIARALAMRPQVLLLDEPTSALDYSLREEVRCVLRQLADEGMTMLMVTHDLRLARQVADRVVFMEGGVVVESGETDSFFQEPQHPRTRAFLHGVEA